MRYSSVTYVLSLLVSFIVYWILAVSGTVAATFSSLISITFLDCIIHFGISSWLFLFMPLTGKYFAIFTASVMCLWPLTIAIGGVEHNEITDVLFALTLIFPNALTIYFHTRMVRGEQKSVHSLNGVFMSLFPLGLSLYALYFLIF